MRGLTFFVLLRSHFGHPAVQMDCPIGCFQQLCTGVPWANPFGPPWKLGVVEQVFSITYGLNDPGKLNE